MFFYCLQSKMSVCKVDQCELYERGMPKRSGLNDLRMGTMDMRLACETCKAEGRETKHCPGHFGSVELATPMYHIGFLTTVLKILKCVCYNCSRLLCKDDPKLQQLQRLRPRARLAQVLELSKKSGYKVCVSVDPESKSMGCGCTQPKYERDLTAAAILIQPAADEESDDNTPQLTRYFHADEAHKILKRITDEDCELMGLDAKRAHPSWMLVTILPVPPPAVRPSVQHGGDRCEDDLTVKLLDIVKVNQQIKRQALAGATRHLLDEYKKTLQFHVFTVVANGIPGLPVATTKTHKPLKSIQQRLKGKEGRLRGNLMGKRVDFSARTVITGDPSLMIDQVGVPRSVAMTLTFPERVTALNKEKLLFLVRNGPHRYPGARFVVREDGVRFDLRYSDPSSVDLGVGWIVERHMQDEDLVLFNRQPSLHKMSIMGHRAKVLPYSTFRLNLSVTSPYNADFDGDEMNLHLAQSHETRAEIRHLMMNPKQVVSPQGNKPVMGIVQDTLLGVSKMTKRDTFLKKDEMMNALMWLPAWDGIMPPPAIIKPQQLWTGKQLFSLLLQDMRISLERDNNLAKDEDTDHKDCRSNDSRVILKDGELLCGVIDKKTVGAQAGSAVHLIWLEHGPEKTKNFLSWTQYLVNHWLLHNGFSVGCADIIANNLTLVKVDQILTKAKSDVKELVVQAQKGTLETQAGKSMFESFEAKVNSVLSDARGTSGLEASESLDDRNNIIAMVLSGSKGSNLNISQIIACVGQQNVEGKRMPFGFENRTLPHFTKDDYGPESRGFVENSYLAGLTPQEFFFHAMGGREGVIDTACKTAETGYIQRRLIKALEDARVHYDRTVRTGNGEVLQFLYGEDGMAGEFIEQQELSLMKMSLADCDKVFKHVVKANVDTPFYMSEVTKAAILKDPSQHETLDREFNRLIESKELLCIEVFPHGDARQHLPVNINRILQNVHERVGRENPKELSPVEVVERVEEMLSQLVICKPLNEKNPDRISLEVQSNATALIYAHLRTQLASKRLLAVHKLGRTGLIWVMGEIIKQFNRALAAAGEVVGTIAAQSVGEPATQMTLNTFHFAGIGSKNVTLGVPRLKEIINVARNIKTPSLTIALDDEHCYSREKAKLVQSRLEYTMMERITAYTQIVYDPDVRTSNIDKDRQFVEDFYEMSFSEIDDVLLSPWVLRVELRERVMADKGVEMREVEKALLDFWGVQNVQVVCSDENAKHLVVRMRLVRQPGNNDNDDIDVEDSEHLLLSQMETRMLNEMSLRGVPGVRKVFMRTNRNDRNAAQFYDPKTGKFSRKEQWVLDTEGVNLRQVMCIEGVDYSHSASNDITEILEVLGIEAARRALLKELRTVLSFDGSYVNYRHLALLCDAMTFRGSFMAITRHGLNRGDRGPLAKASFEETVDILMEAAALAETDHLKGVSEPIIMGQLCDFGTGSFDVLVDDMKLAHATAPAAINDLTSDAETSTHYGGANSSAYTPYNTSGSNMGLNNRSFGGGDVPFSPLQAPTSPLQMGFSKSHMMSAKNRSADLSFAPMSPLVQQEGHAQNMKMLHQQFGRNNPMAAQISMQNKMMNSYTPTSPFATSPVVSPARLAATTPNVLNKTSRRLDQNALSAFSPHYSPTSPMSGSPTSPHYSPTSPRYSPTSPQVGGGVTSPHYSPTSPHYSPTSPAYSPTSPMSQLNAAKIRAAGITSPNYSPTSPQYSPTSPKYSPTSPIHSPSSPLPPSANIMRTLRATSPQYSPTSPSYSPTSPKYN